MSKSDDFDEEELLISYVQAALQQMDRGEEVVPEVLCADHPALIAAVVEALGLSEHLPALQKQAMSEDPLTGRMLADRYELTKCIGRGAMGVVYLAQDRQLPRSVAIKILDGRLFNDPDAEERFEREARVLATLQHHNIVAIHDRGRTPEGIHFLVMELLDGMTLAAVLESTGENGDPTETLDDLLDEPLAERHWPRIVAKWCVALAHGLEASHAKSVIHRDIKPSNILLTTEGRAVLLDFGIAKSVSDAQLTATDAALGTPAYMAPEAVMAAAEHPLNPASDIYSLGATMYHLLGGREPYVGSVATILMELQQGDPKPLLHQQPDLPRDLVAIVECCMARSPGMRYPSAASLYRDLECFLAHQPVSARPTTAIGRQWRKWRRAPARPLAVLATAIAALIAAISIPIYFEQRSQDILAQKHSLYRSLPALLAIDCWPDERVLAELNDENHAALQQLDQLLVLDPRDLPTRLWRACLQLDLDHREEAAADLAYIAANESSAYFRELADRYRNSQAALLGAESIDLTDLPEPVSSTELYVAGFHELRNRHIAGYSKRSEDLLRRASADYLPARDLRLIALASLAEQPKSQRPEGRTQPQLVQELYDETIALEAIYGQPTARTCAMRGVALVMQQKYQESIPELKASLAIRPDRQALHLNLGIAYRRMGDLATSELHLQRALRLHSFSWNSRYTLAQVFRDQSNFDAAWQIMASLKATGERGEAWKHAKLAGSIAMRESVHLLDSDPEAAKVLADKAVASFRRLVEIRTKSSRSRKQLARAQAMLSDEKEVILAEFAMSVLQELNRSKPEFHYQLATLAHVISKHGMEASEAPYLAAILRKIAAKQVPGNVIFAQQQEAKIQQLLQKMQAR